MNTLVTTFQDLIRTPDHVISQIIAVHDLLAAETDVSPRNRKITPALRSLVGLLLESYEPVTTATILNHSRVVDLRRPLLDRLSQAEAELEFFWSRCFLRRPALRLIDLEEFLYWRHYERLLALELQALTKIRWRLKAHKGRSIVFVGSGALPLSAIVLHMLTGEPVICVDADEAASDCAKQLLAKLGLSNILAVHGDGAAFAYDDASVIFIAALVARKTAVAHRIAETCQEPIVAVRTVEGLRTLLYRPADVAALRAAGLCLLGQTMANPEAINNTLFFSVCPRKIPCLL